MWLLKLTYFPSWLCLKYCALDSLLKLYIIFINYSCKNKVIATSQCMTCVGNRISSCMPTTRVLNEYIYEYQLIVVYTNSRIWGSNITFPYSCALTCVHFSCIHQLHELSSLLHVTSDRILLNILYLRIPFKTINNIILITLQMVATDRFGKHNHSVHNHGHGCQFIFYILYTNLLLKYLIQL